MLRSEHLLTIDLERDYDEELKKAQEVIQDTLKKRRKNRRDELYIEAWGTGNPSLIALGAAMMLSHHSSISEVADKLPCDPTPEDIAYYVAQHHLADTELSDRYEEKIRRKLLVSFNAMDFVFDHTHYDECDNGHFYRRS